MKHPGFETFEVTADAGIMAWGDDLRELFANAARGMFALLVEPGTVGAAEVLPIEAHGAALPSLLVAWLNELLYRCEVEAWAPSDVQVFAVQREVVKGALAGEPIDRERHRLRGAVKAATYHLLECRRDGALWRARVVFDV